jgi:hypothetical protein
VPASLSCRRIRRVEPLMPERVTAKSVKSLFASRSHRAPADGNSNEADLMAPARQTGCVRAARRFALDAGYGDRIRASPSPGDGDGRRTRSVAGAYAVHDPGDIPVS